MLLLTDSIDRKERKGFAKNDLDHWWPMILAMLNSMFIVSNNGNLAGHTIIVMFYFRLMFIRAVDLKTI